MFAVIKTGGKQYKVASGAVLTVEKLAAEAGETVQFNEVLMVGAEGDVTVGAPTVAGAGVQAEVLEQTRGPKVISFKRRRRKHSSKRRRGHRQDLTLVRITEILASGADKSGAKAATGKAPAAQAAPAKKAAAKKAAAAPAAAAAGDDMTAFKGVGPKMAEKLVAAGVTSYQQIIDWSEDEAAAMDEQLGLKGKILGDDWAGQAASFQNK